MSVPRHLTLIGPQLASYLPAGCYTLEVSQCRFRPNYTESVHHLFVLCPRFSEFRWFILVDIRHITSGIVESISSSVDQCHCPYSGWWLKPLDYWGRITIVACLFHPFSWSHIGTCSEMYRSFAPMSWWYDLLLSLSSFSIRSLSSTML